jgi:hypothetical protein
LPTLQADTKPQLGKRVSASGVELGLAIVSSLRSSTPALERVSLHDGQLDITLSGPPLIMIKDSKHPAEVIPQLQALLAKFAADHQYPAQVDMRFDRPVLRN